MSPEHIPRRPDGSETDGHYTALVRRTLTPSQWATANYVVDQAEARAPGRPIPQFALTTPAWLRTAGMSDDRWRKVRALPPGALAAVALARLMDRGTLIGDCMVEIGVFPREARADDPEWVPDRISFDQGAVALRGELSYAGLTCDNELVRFVVHDVPLGGVRDGEVCLQRLVSALTETFDDPFTPLGALLGKTPVFVRRGSSIAYSQRGEPNVTRVGIEQTPALRNWLDVRGVRYVSRFYDDAPLMADLTPIDRDAHDRLRPCGGPHVVLSTDVLDRLKERTLDGVDAHRVGLDDDAYDGKSYFSVYPSGFGLPDVHGRFEAVGVCVYQLGRPEAYLISNWDLRRPTQRQELAAVVHFASDRNALRTIADCRGRARWRVDRFRPSLRDDRGDMIAAELEHVFYMFHRLGQMQGSRI